MTDFKLLRKFTVTQMKTNWYKKFCELYDKEDLVALRRKVASSASLFNLIAPNLSWYEGRPGPQITRQELFTIRFPKVEPRCAVCQGQVSLFGKRKWRHTCSLKCAAIECTEKRRNTCFLKYGVDNPGKAESVKLRRVETFIKRFGKTNPFANASVKRKIKKTNFSKFGVANPSQFEAVKKKKEKTMLKNFGATHWTKVRKSHFDTNNPMHIEDCVDKMRKTNLKRHGSENAMHSKVVQAKLKKTFMDKYGVDNPRKAESVKETIQNTNLKRYGVTNAGCLFNTSYDRKVVTDKRGQKHLVQGYEDIMIRELDELDNIRHIYTGSRNVIRVRYKDKKDKTRNYYPDLRVELKSGKRIIIEVKSSFTLNIDLERNLRKFRAATKFCLKKGFTFWVCIVSPKGETRRVKNPTCLKDLREANLPVRRLLLTSQ